MKAQRRDGLRLAWGLGLSTLVGSASAKPQALPLQWRETAMLAYGTTIWLRAAHADAARAQAGLDAAADAVRRVDQLMSLYRDDSELVQLNREGVLHGPSAELVAVLRLGLQVAAASGGAFDPTVQPLWRVWRAAQREGRQPSHLELQQARALVGWRAVGVSDARIALARPGMALTLNGIAQGFAADQARAALQRHGIAHALLDTGEWLPMGRAPDDKPWQLGVADPRAADPRTADPPIADPRAADAIVARLLADGRAIACSSDDKCSFSADRRDHHIFDPRSGRSPTQLASVVVAAPSAALADALTKPLFMGNADDALRLARRRHVDVLVVDKAGRWTASPGLRVA